MTILLTQLVMRPAFRITALLQVFLLVFLGAYSFLLLAQARSPHLAASLLPPAHLSAASLPSVVSFDSQMLAAASAPRKTDPRRAN
jgi:hypothetical protein